MAAIHRVLVNGEAINSVAIDIGLLKYDNGNTYSFNYKIENEGITINGMYFEQA